MDATISTPFARMERKSDLILSTCIVGTQRLGSDVVLISGAAETDPGADNRERRGTDHDSLHTSVTGGPDSPEVRSRWKQAIGTRQAVRIHIPIHNSSRADRNRHPMPPEDQNYAVYCRPFPQPGISGVFSTAWQLPLFPPILGKFWKKSLARVPSITTLAVDRAPPGGGEEASLCRLHHPCQCFKRVSCLRAQTCLDRDVRCIFNSLKPETVLACRDSCSQGICLQLQQWRGWLVVSTTYT